MNMGQVTIYLDNEAERRLKAAARTASVSVSRFVAELIRNRTRTDWPPEVRQLAGAWPDFPDLAEIRQASGKDRLRDTL